MTAKRPWRIIHTQWQRNSIVDDDDNLVCECCTGHEPSREFADECAADIILAVNHHEELMEIARAVKRFDSFTACGEVEAVSKEARSLLDRIEKGGE